MTGPVVVVGDALLDRDLVGRVERLCPDAPVPVLEDLVEGARPGGAGLAATLAVADGHAVTLVTALSADDAGQRLRRLLAAAGVDVVDLRLDGPTPEKLRVGAPGHPMVRLDRGGGPAPIGPLGEDARTALRAASAVLVSDYGRGVAAAPDVRHALGRLPVRTPLVWDPHRRGADPLPGVRLATPNAAEAGLRPDAALSLVATAGRRLRAGWRAAGVAVTLGRRGALLIEGDGPPLAVPAPAAILGDPCGAGDRFAAAAAVLLAGGALPSEAVTGAVHSASAFVAAGGVSAVAQALAGKRLQPATAGDPLALVESVKARGGTVVAAGGCFDVLHAGHVALLGAARALGDCLVVCLNSDESVRRLKGQGRPLQPAGDRTALLLALGCVDAVMVFEENTPLAVLDRLRPDVFAKGADYSLEQLPESELLASWGGQTVVLPYLEGRSTTRLVKEVMRHVRM